MSFQHQQPSVSNGAFGTGVASLVLALGATPPPGSLVIVAASTFDNTPPTFSSIKDSNNNPYTPTTSTPYTGASSISDVFLYYLVAPVGATGIITLTLSTAIVASSGGVTGFADVFTLTSLADGLIYYDKDAAANAASVASPTNAPTITPTYANSLLYGYGVISSHFTGVVTPPWITNTFGEGANGDWSEWILQDSVAQSVGLTYTGTQSWATMAASFYYELPSAPMQVGGNVHKAVKIQGY
jgi:hypothetical protein